MSAVASGAIGKRTNFFAPSFRASSLKVLSASRETGSASTLSFDVTRRILVTTPAWMAKSARCCSTTDCNVLRDLFVAEVVVSVVLSPCANAWRCGAIG